MEERDFSNGNWLRMHNAILDDYGRLLGSDAITVYAVLARFANNRTQVCWPSLATIRGRTGLSRPTIIKALRKMERLNLIKIERILGGNNTYTLLDVRPVKGVYYPVNDIDLITRQINKTGFPPPVPPGGGLEGDLSLSNPPRSPLNHIGGKESIARKEEE